MLHELRQVRSKPALAVHMSWKVSREPLPHHVSLGCPAFLGLLQGLRKVDTNFLLAHCTAICTVASVLACAWC